MKRSGGELTQGEGREKHARHREDAAGSSISTGSRTTVRQAGVLTLQSTREREDEHEEEEEEEEGDDEDSEDDFDLEDGSTTEGLLLAVSSKKVRVRAKVLKLLLNRLSELDSSQRSRLAETSLRMLYTEADKGVKILLIQVLQNGFEGASMDGRSTVEHLLSQLHADSTEVRVQIYDTISYIIKIGRLPRSSLSNINTIRAIVTTSIAELKDRHHRIRSAVLQLIAQLAPLLKSSDLPLAPASSQHHSYTQYDIQRIVSNYVTDPEPRVRKNACKALLELHRQGFKLGLALYDVATQALLDDYQEVRLEGLDLIFGLYPDQIVQDPSASQVQATRLVDDAFIRICDMVNDSSMIVRAKACSLLGRFRSVEYKFLSQTFSKQIMARLRVDVAPKNLAAGPAQKQAQRAKLIATPEGDQDVTAQQVRLLDSGACGAFVHGLEDEYQDVRNAAINSICELCLQNPEFSVLALDYMVDMFMDEIDYVRLNALTSLYKIGSKSPITFDTEQLQITLGVLEDADRDVRESTHRMLGVITMATADGMTSFLASIESNVKRFPEDQLSIYQCIRAVARRHGAFVESIVPEILNLNKMYLPIEENVESMLYGGHLILIFNAAISNPRILSMLPKYTYKHYTYLRDKYPNCFPEPSEIPCPGTQPLRDLASALTMTIDKDANQMEIEEPDPSESTNTEGVSSAYATTISAMRVQTEQDAEAFYERILRNLDRINLLWRSQRPSQTNEVSDRHRSMVLQQIAVCQRDLRYIVSVHAKQGRNAEFADMFLECCGLLLQIQEIYDTPSFIMLAPALSAQLFRLSYYMDHTFLGIDATTKISVGFFRVLANLVWFFGMAQNRAASSSSLRSRKQELGSTREYLQSMLRLAIKRMTGLLQQMDQPEVDHRRVQTHRAVLEHLRLAVLQALKSPSTQEIIKLMSNIVNIVPMQINLRNLDLNRIRAQVMRPLPNRDTPLEVHPTFPFLIHVEGVIHHISDTTGVAVQVSFPQNVVRLYYPPPDHFTLMEDDQVLNTKDKKKPAHQGATPGSSRTYRLRTSIEIYPDAAWGYTAAELGITLTRSFQPDLVGHDEFICRFAQDVVTEKRQKAEGGETSSSSSASASRRPQQLSLQPSVETMDRTSNALTEQSQSTLEISKSTSYFITRQRTYSK